MSCRLPRGFVASLLPLLVLFASDSASASRVWETLDGVKMVPSRYADGDSFWATHRGREYVFRIYGADCPETDMSFPERVADQASEFGVTPSATVDWGHRAAARTSDLLKTPFRVVTRWESALGRSNVPRHYAYVLPAGAGDLAANLIAEGFARARGKNPVLPPGFPRVGTAAEYLHLQYQARTSARGIWSTPSPPVKSSQSNAPSSAVFARKVNVNTATPPQLESLPGIGEVLAARIVEFRPYRTEADLLKVPGLGAARLAKIRPLVAF